MTDRTIREEDRAPRVSLDQALEAVTRGEPDWTQARAQILRIENRFASISRPIRPTELNPGGTVSGPTLFWMCDAVLFVATLASRGESARSAATVSMTINFVRAAAPSAIQADCRIVRSGKRLIVGEVRVFPADRPDWIIANATGIFSARAQSIS